MAGHLCSSVAALVVCPDREGTEQDIVGSHLPRLCAVRTDLLSSSSRLGLACLVREPRADTAAAQPAPAVYVPVCVCRRFSWRLCFEGSPLAMAGSFHSSRCWNVPGTTLAVSSERAYRVAGPCSEESVGSGLRVDPREYSYGRNLCRRS